MNHTVLWRLFGLLCLLTSLNSLAAREGSATISPGTFKKLQKIEKLIAQPAYSEAIQNLNALLPSVARVPFEKAIVLKTIASVHALQGNYSKASEALEQSLATKVLPIQQEQHAMINLAQLYIGQGDNKRAASIMESWLSKAKTVSGDDYLLLANVYAQLNRYREALPYIKKAIAAAKYPKESWYQLLLALHYETENYQACANTLEIMIQKFPPKKAYWNQLAGVYQQLKQHKKAVAVKKLAYRQGLLTSAKEILDLVSLMRFIGAPYQAGELLKTEMDNGRIEKTATNYRRLSDTWTQAQEFDLAAQTLEKAAAMSHEGELYGQLGRIYIEQEKWAKAQSALRNAFKKGHIKDRGNLNVLFGMACYELSDKKQAVSAFKKALDYQKTRKIARQWLNYIDAEA